VTIFVLGTAFILYVIFGYPLWIALWAGMRPQHIQRKFTPRTVSILLPVHNGSRWLADKLRYIRELNYPPELIETIVISSASSDDTLSIAQQQAQSQPHQMHIIELQQPGKARALNAGLAVAHGDILFFTDVRQWLQPDSLRTLVADLGDPRVGVVSGELMIREGDSREESSVGLYWKYEKLIRSAQSRIDSLPGATGAIYAMRRSLARPLPEDTLLDDVYLPLCAYIQGYRLTWEPDAKAFDYPASLKTEFWRKVRTLAGVYQIIGRFPRLLLPTHRLWIHFISHKLARLLVPYALIAVFVSSFALPSPLKYLVLLGQIGLYGLAALDRILPDKSPLKRLSSPIGTFVVMMAAALCAASILFIPPDRLWKSTR
jgi:cellulose synthase/poly-beta-1,6-N-acetylglucosamine synthase-like glycosyltransferase